jgi:hypothetical protein
MVYLPTNIVRGKPDRALVNTCLFKRSLVALMKQQLVLILLKRLILLALDIAITAATFVGCLEIVLLFTRLAGWLMTEGGADIVCTPIIGRGAACGNGGSGNPGKPGRFGNPGNPGGKGGTPFSPGTVKGTFNG